MASHPSTPTESAYVVRGDVSPETIARSLRALLPARLRPIARHRFTVLDTFDTRIRRAGTRLTCDDIDGRPTLEWQPSAGSASVTAHFDGPVGFAWDLPDPLKRALAPVIGVRRLLPQADGEEFGWLLEMLDERGKTVARLRIESGRARLPSSQSAWQSLPTVITLSGMRGYEEVYRRLVPVIESRPGTEPCPEGFHGVMLRSTGVPDGVDISSLRIKLAPRVRAEIGARQIHLALLDVLVANEPGLRANLDTEFLHDFRVAVRRTRALLSQIRKVFPSDRAEHFATEFSWLGRVTGPPRDIDVLVLTLRDHRAEIPEADLSELTALLNEAQQREHQALVSVLDGDRYRRLLAEWRMFLEQPASRESDASNARRPLVEVVSERAWTLYRRIARRAQGLEESASHTRVHEVRIDVKKLRYLVDVTSAFYDPGDLDRILDALKKLQRVLGDFHDCHVQAHRLLEYGYALGASGRSGALLALGRLSEQRRQRCESLRKPIAKAVSRFRDKHIRSACRHTFKSNCAPERIR